MRTCLLSTVLLCEVLSTSAFWFIAYQQKPLASLRHRHEQTPSLVVPLRSRHEERRNQRHRIGFHWNLHSIKTKDKATGTSSFEEDESHSTRSEKKPFLDKISLEFQSFMRDSGILRNCVDLITRTVLAPAFYYENPHRFPEFIRISEYPHWLYIATSHAMYQWNVTDPNNAHDGDRIAELSDSDSDSDTTHEQTKTHKIRSRIAFQKERYGTHHRQIADVMVNENLQKRKDVPMFIFLHGGAWGSGFPTMYRLISSPFLERNYRAVVLGYRTYPDGTMEDQVQDLADAVEYFTTKYAYASVSGSISSSTIDDNLDNTRSSSPKVVLMGHSSGAHIVMLAALKGRFSSRVDALIGMSGVYDLTSALAKELQEGLTKLSPMGPCCKDQFEENSPTWLIEQRQINPSDKFSSPGDGELDCLPPVLLLHGDDDPVASPIQSESLYKILKESETNSNGSAFKYQYQFELLKGVQHQDTVLETCLGRGRTQNIIFEWLEKLSDRNTNYV